MTRIITAGAAMLLAACTPPAETDETPDVEIENGEYETGTTDGSDAETAPDDGRQTVAGFEGTEMARPIDGRWGIQYEACSEDNDSADGVIQISRYDVITGLEACAITGLTESGGHYEIDALCDGMDGAYENTFHFSSPQEGVLRWDNRALDRVEDYVNCDGGAMH